MSNSSYIPWLSNRPTASYAAANVLPTSTDLWGNRTWAIIRQSAIIPSHLILTMILLAAVAVCSTVIRRSHAQLTASAAQYQRMATEVESMRRANAALGVEIARMKSDPASIEASARSRLGMVRANDIVVPIASLQSR